MGDHGRRMSETAWLASPLWAALDVAGWWDALSGRERLLLSSLALVLVLLAGAFVIYLADRWRRRTAPSTICDANEQMASFRELYERGELSRQEFESIRNKLTGRLRQELEARAAPEQSAKPASSDGPPSDDKPPTPPEAPMQPM